jgi:lysophospholipase L1-like esterase
LLARRLQQACQPGSPAVALVNRGICGNCLLTDYANALIAGHDCLERFDRDVLATTGAAWLFVLIGINDIVYSPSASTIPADDLAAGYQQLVNRAHLAGLRAIGATLTPFEGQAYYTPAREAVLQRRLGRRGRLRPGAARPVSTDPAEPGLRQRRPPAPQRRRLPAVGAGGAARPVHNQLGARVV